MSSCRLRRKRGINWTDFDAKDIPFFRPVYAFEASLTHWHVTTRCRRDVSALIHYPVVWPGRIERFRSPPIVSLCQTLEVRQDKEAKDTWNFQVELSLCRARAIVAAFFELAIVRDIGPLATLKEPVT